MNALLDLDKKLLKNAARQKKEEKVKRFDEKYQTCDSLPNDWSLKRTLEIQLKLDEKATKTTETRNKLVEEIIDLVNPKQISKSLSYNIYMPVEIPRFLQENQSKSTI